MIRVTCAVIRNEDNEVLVVQRGEKTDHPFKWEFPGGKVDSGESDEDCIIREIKEELFIDVVIVSRMEEVFHNYGKKQILLVPFICDTLDDLPMLAEHIAFRWIEPEELMKVDFSEADITVAANYLKTIGLGEENTSPSEICPPGDDCTEEEFREMIHSTMGTRQVEWIAASALENPAIFSKLFRYSFSGDKKLAFHSSWALSKVADKSPEAFTDYIPRIVDALGKLSSESTERSFLRILTLSDVSRLSTKQQGILADYCFTALRSGFSAIAIKAYSMEIIYRLALIYPELSHELAASINMLRGEGSAGIKARGKIILRRLSKSGT
jgi:8-oxo-dGTP diphosphatase